MGPSSGKRETTARRRGGEEEKVARRERREAGEKRGLMNIGFTFMGGVVRRWMAKGEIEGEGKSLSLRTQIWYRQVKRVLDCYDANVWPQMPGIDILLTNIPGRARHSQPRKPVECMKVQSDGMCMGS